MDADTSAALRNLLVREDTLSELAALKQDAKNFGYQMMVAERQKQAHAGALASCRQNHSATARHFPAKHKILRKPRALLYDIRSAPDDGQDSRICICCAKLGNDTGRSTTISSRPLAMAWRQIEQETKEHRRSLRPSPGEKAAGGAAGGPRAAALCRRDRRRHNAVRGGPDSVRSRSCRKMTFSPPERLCERSDQPNGAALAGSRSGGGAVQKEPAVRSR